MLDSLAWYYFLIFPPNKESADAFPVSCSSVTSEIQQKPPLSAEKTGSTLDLHGPKVPDHVPPMARRLRQFVPQCFANSPKVVSGRLGTSAGAEIVGVGSVGWVVERRVEMILSSELALKAGSGLERNKQL